MYDVVKVACIFIIYMLEYLSLGLIQHEASIFQVKKTITYVDE